MYFVYLIQHNKTMERYIGYTSDLNKRLSYHNSGNNKSTRRDIGKCIIIYYEGYRSKTDAISRERQLKRHGRGKQILVKWLSNSLIEDV